MRAKAEIETHTTHDKIIVNEIPYNVNKKELIENIASLVNDKKIDGISYVNDESDREGMRIVIDVKRDANASIVLNKLYKDDNAADIFWCEQCCIGTWPSTSVESERFDKTLR